MGCDIHWVLETKTDRNWLGLMSSDSTNFIAGNRWYSFFTELGLPHRGESDTAVTLAGFPVDPSELSLYEFSIWSGEAHSPSYLSLDSYVAAYNRALSRHYPSEKLITARKLFGDWFWTAEDGNGYRVVFWFDN